MLAKITERFWFRLRRACVAGAVEKKIFHIGQFILIEIFVMKIRAEGTRRPLDLKFTFGFLSRGVAFVYVVLREGKVKFVYRIEVVER